MTIEVIATTRKAQGTGASRRLRKAGRLPGILYGSGEVVLLDLEQNDIYYKLRSEEFHASVLNLNLDGKTETVVLRDFVMHPFRQQVQHIDFQRIDPSKKMHIKVPLHFLNEDTAPGVKTGGGKVNHVVTELDVVCLPKDIPQFIEVDVGALTVGHSIHVSELKLPAGVEVANHGASTGDAVVVSIQAPRGGAADETPAAEPAKK